MFELINNHKIWYGNHGFLSWYGFNFVSLDNIHAKHRGPYLNLNSSIPVPLATISWVISLIHGRISLTYELEQVNYIFFLKKKKLI